ncbi:hypothetical protein Hanom_Chr09g00852121 [Helianthus anomalus]
MANDDEPENYSVAGKSNDWIKAMKKEIESTRKNKTWQVTKLPQGHKPTGLHH